MASRKKLIYAALAAIAGGGALYAYYSKKEEEEGSEDTGSGSTKIVDVNPNDGTQTDGAGGGAGEEEEEEILGSGGSGVPSKLCRSYDEEGSEIAELVGPDDECPEGFYDDTEWDDFQYDSTRCYDVDESGEVVEQEKDFDEVCGVDYPDFPFESRNDALLYAQDPESFEGCTDENAFNYDPSAMFDDGTCEAVVVGCMNEAALNFDPEANTEEEDSCEFALDAVMGCTNEEAKNFDSEANTDDGTCLYDVTCWRITDAPYSVTSEVVEMGEGMTCEASFAPFYADLAYTDNQGNPQVIEGILWQGYFNTEANALALLTSAFDSGNDLTGGEYSGVSEYSTCFLVYPDTLEISEGSSYDLAEDETCEMRGEQIGVPLFTDFESAEAYVDAQADSMETQSCYSWDSQGVFILDDLPVINDNNESVTCTELGYYSLSIGGEADAQEAYEEYLQSLVQIEEELGDTEADTDPIANDSNEEPPIPPQGEDPDAEIDSEEPPTGLEEEDLDAEDLSAPPIGNIMDCEAAGSVPNSVLTNYLQGGVYLTSNEVNDALGFVCFDPETGVNLYEPPPLPAGTFESANEVNSLISSCIDTSNTALVGQWLTGMNSVSFPASYQEVNDAIGFDCFDENLEPVNPYTPSEPEEPVNDFEDVIVDDSGDVPTPEPSDPTAGLGSMPAPTDTGSDPKQPKIQKEFAGFVNSSENSEGGCTDPIALNYNEGAVFDDGSCMY